MGEFLNDAEGLTVVGTGVLIVVGMVIVGVFTAFRVVAGIKTGLLSEGDVS